MGTLSELQASLLLWLIPQAHYAPDLATHTSLLNKVSYSMLWAHQAYTSHHQHLGPFFFHAEKLEQLFLSASTYPNQQGALPWIAIQKGLTIGIACGLVEQRNSAGSTWRRPPWSSTAQQTLSLNRHSQVLHHLHYHVCANYFEDLGPSIQNWGFFFKLVLIWVFH